MTDIIGIIGWMVAGISALLLFAIRSNDERIPTYQAVVLIAMGPISLFTYFFIVIITSMPHSFKNPFYKDDED